MFLFMRNTKTQEANGPRLTHLSEKSHCRYAYFIRALTLGFPLETICMKCQLLFSRKNKKNFNMSSAELAQKEVTGKQGSKAPSDGH